MRTTLLTLVLTGLLLTVPGANADSLQTYPISDGTFLIDWRSDFSVREQQKLRDWLRLMGDSVTLLHGEWPRKQIRIALQKHSRSQAVAFGRVLRGRPQGIQFYVNPDRPLEEFLASWTPYHEFAHLFIPYPGRPDIWFSEGLASYYQNILQVRAGQLTAGEARDKFAAAFQRGQDDDAHGDLTLGELSAEMRKRHAFMRVYWSGALYFLEADLTLRTQQKPTTLDNVLRAYNQCCLPVSGIRRGKKLAAEFDRLAGSTVFTELYAKYEISRAIPAWQTLLEKAWSAGLLVWPQELHAVE